MARHSTGGCDMVHHSVAERSHPKSEVRGRSREEPTPKGQRPRGVTPRSRSRAVAESTRLQWRRNCGEELPRVRGQGGPPRGDTQRPRSGAVGGRSYPTPPCLRPGAAAEGATPRPRSRGCAGAGGPGGAIPRWRSRGAAVRRYPSSKVRSNGCSLLEQPWRDTPHPR